MSTIEAQVPVPAPAATTFARFARFEDYPEFMRAVDQVTRDTAQPDHVRFVFSVAGIPRHYGIVAELDPDGRTLRWRSESGPNHHGVATVRAVGDEASVLDFTAQLDLDGLIERLGEATGIIDRRVRADLDRFAAHVAGELDAAESTSDGGAAAVEPKHQAPLEWLFDKVFPTDERSR